MYPSRIATGPSFQSIGVTNEWLQTLNTLLAESILLSGFQSIGDTNEW